MTKDKTYMVNEIFYSLQGEGMRAGTANVFVRFAGCNLLCKKAVHGFDCDTDFSGGARRTVQEILDGMNRIGRGCRNVILTGGEPLLQAKADFIYFLKDLGWYVAVETNGTQRIPAAIDWVTVSPKEQDKMAAIPFKVDELKYVRGCGQGIPVPTVKASHLLISPAFDGARKDQAALDWCIGLVKENPNWRLSVQQHKTWRIR